MAKTNRLAKFVNGKYVKKVSKVTWPTRKETGVIQSTADGLCHGGVCAALFFFFVDQSFASASLFELVLGIRRLINCMACEVVCYSRLFRL